MADPRLDRMERLFRAALMHPPEERDSFLEAACQDDPELLAEVRSLIEADRQAEQKEFLEKPITSLSGLDDYLGGNEPESTERFIGQEIGPYRILRFIGHGGMGDVYLAVREEPFRQHVALKIIRRGMDTAEVTRRFEMERQILASLNHTNIGRLYDGGVTDEGLPYFAMEYVDGLPITEFCDARSLSIEERLRLFQHVCRAAHHAHQNLIIHRDIKPSNILVTGDANPKLLDFGIAKLLNPNLGPGDAPVTRTEIRAMTPEYASPEQARGESLTTASDVYSLGVILYELLTGHRPYYFRKKTSDEILSVLGEHEPERPSSIVTTARVSTPGREKSQEIEPQEIGRRRGTSPDRLRRRLSGDLDNIVLMAMRKEPERRYASAEQLAGDIDSYLKGSPVIAHRDSAGYRIRKFVQRHRVQTIAVATILLLLILGTGVTIYQANRLAQERDRARLEAERAEQVTGFLISLFEASDPSFAPGDTLTVRELLDQGADRIGSELGDQPSIQATLYDVIGTAYINLGHYELAEEPLSRALEIRRDLPDEEGALARSLYTLGFAHELAGEFSDAEKLYRESLAIQKRLAPKTTSPFYLVSLFHLGSVAHFIGASDEAESIYNEWEELYQRVSDRDDPELTDATYGMAHVSFARKEFELAEKYITAVLAARIREKGKVHAEVAAALMLLGSVQLSLDEPERALETAENALAMLEEIYPDGHRDIASTTELLGNTREKLGQIGRAERLLLRAVELWTEYHGPDHLSTGLAHARLGGFYLTYRRYAEASGHSRRGAEVATAVLGEESPVTIRIRAALAQSLIELGRTAEAERILRKSLLLLEGRPSDDELLVSVRTLLDRID